MKTFKSGVFVLFVFLFSNLVLLGADAHADSVIRNGDFESDLSHWNINPALPATWNPLVVEPVTDYPNNHAVKLHPPSFGFNGDIIYQNLNVTGIANKTFYFSCNLSSMYPPSGSSIAVYVDYVDDGVITSDRLINPLNSTITTATPKNRSFPFSATATRLLKLRVAKENYGEFTVDNITFDAVGITVGSVPAITSLSAASGSYGGQFTINGSGFGNSAGNVTISGSSAGVVINNWSDTSVTVTVNDPVRSGAVVLTTSDKVESNSDKRFAVSSPNYISELVAPTVQVVKGQMAEFVLKTDFLNGLSPAGGVTFAVNGIPAGGTYTFSPVPLMRSGGVVLKVNTAAISAGTYDLSIQASSTGMTSRTVAGKLVVTTTSTLDFYQTTSLPTPPYSSRNLVTSPLSVSSQGNLSLSITANDSGSLPISEIQLVSSNPSVVGVYKNAFGYDVYAHNNGTAILTATAPDGIEKTLTVNVTFASTSRVDIGLNPQTMTNKYTGLVQLRTTFTFGAGEWYSAGTPSMALTDSTLGFNSNRPPYYYGGDFKVDHSKTQLGTYLFSGSITTGVYGSTLYSNVAPLVITNDPSYAGLNVTIKSLDSSVMPQMYEYFDVEFYNAATGLIAFTLGNRIFTMGDKFFIGAITPGTYKIRIVPTGSQVMPQWYPNADSAADAQPITFTAAVNDGPRYFFARKAPDTTPPFITAFTVPTPSSSLLVSNIVLSGFDSDSGMSAYCLTETNNPSSCAWLASSPSSHTFSASGTRTLYAFLKDSAGNISLTDQNSTKQVNIVLEFPLTLAFAGTGGGQVNGAISCVSGTACSPVMFPETPGVSLLAAADTDSTFGGWSGCNSVSGTTCNVTVNAIKTVTATFVLSPKVRIEGGSADGFPSLHLAYDAASSNALAPSTIQVRSVLLPDVAFSFDRSISVTVKGGYDSSYSPTNAGVSTIAGPVTFKGGPVTIEKLAVK